MTAKATAVTLRRDIPAIVLNVERLYEGNLHYYHHTIVTKAKNLNNPYHNYRHMTHVFWLCYQACLFYRNTLSRREMRNLLIAALFHDFDHCGKMGNDALNIARALEALDVYLLDKDRPYIEDIKAILGPTEFRTRNRARCLASAGASFATPM